MTLSGCLHGGARPDEEGRDGMDMQGAARRADGILNSVMGAIHPEVQWAHGPTTTGSCDVTRRRMVMTVVSEERRGNFLGLVDRFWRDSDYRIKAVNRDVEFPAIYAQTSDGFGVSLSVGGKGQAFFEVDSPCVEESEVAESTTPPNGPSYEGVYPLPRPNVHSDFWSAGAS
ncbi:hypothetical protein [Streptomyces sp. RKAG290]|uniref:hypothetical protein n=1 Tax=Streptomyces sp. RKAG290 TaxID=2888348 RepID=UPI002033652D|nr:hypothetical protein [Streptomyces sp. RKAG290]MCM2412722.1 hypothetical protein [Streptomyces sp. RKAG290]